MLYLEEDFVVEGAKALNGMENLYQNNYIVVSVFVIVGILLPLIALTLGKLLRPHRPSSEKQTTYESGIEPTGGSWVQFNVRYYMFALLFVLFDVEAVFLYPWAVAYDDLGLFALIEMVIFMFMLIIGLLYAWKKKVLTWI